MLSYRCFPAIALALCSSIGTSLAAEPTDLPRYHLQVGQELVYRSADLFNHQNGSFMTQGRWNIWVVRANPDGSWRLIMRSSNSFSQASTWQALLQSFSSVFQGASEKHEDATLAYCDFFPDGRIIQNDSFGYRVKPESVLIRLPQDEAEKTKGWTSRDARMDEIYRYRMSNAPVAADHCLIEVERESPMNVIYGFVFKDVATFDAKRGLPEKIEMASKQTYGFKGAGKGTITLEDVKTHEGAWCRDFATEAERYFAAKAEYDHALESNKAVAELKAAMQQAASQLKEVRKELRMPELQKQLGEILAKHDQMSKYYIEEAENRAAVLDKPAAEWTSKDLNGKTHALKDYRGKVVVLDFWYRGCGWCVRSMPQMKEIAANFKGKPVVVFGMNTDRKEEDAIFVIEKMGLNYTNLKATGLPEKYKVRGFPTLLIIDQNGIVRDIHVGYSPTLKDEVVSSVTKLLNAKS